MLDTGAMVMNFSFDLQATLQGDFRNVEFIGKLT